MSVLWNVSFYLMFAAIGTALYVGIRTWDQMRRDTEEDR